jgi:hypothetical protein
MTAIWIGVLVTAGVTAILVWTSRRHRVDLTDRGTLSQQWLSEQRLNDRHNSER